MGGAFSGSRQSLGTMLNFLHVERRTSKLTNLSRVSTVQLSVLPLSLWFPSSRHLAVLFPSLGGGVTPPEPLSKPLKGGGEGAGRGPPLASLPPSLRFLRGPVFCGEIPHLVPIAACTPAAVGSV